MSLLDFQTALGRAVRTPTGKDPLRGLDLDSTEREDLLAIIGSAGFRFTIVVQRSWNLGRSIDAARFTLSLLPVEERRSLLDEWVSGGGGATPFFAAEADAFLDFISKRLRDPSHALTLCEVERATRRADEGSRRGAAPNLSGLRAPDCVLVAGRYAALVRFHADPRLLLAALTGEPLPPLSSEVIPVLFGLGLEGLSRIATGEEMRLWERLTVPISFAELLREGHRRETIEALIEAGCAEYLIPAGDN